MPITEQEILDQLNAEAAAFTFPMLDNGYLYHCDQLLRLFRDGERWAILLQVLARHNRMPGVEGLLNIAYTFGNCIGGDARNDDGNFFSFVEDHEIPAFVEKAGEAYLNPEAWSIRIRDTVIPLRHDAAHYAAKGIRLEPGGRISAEAFMRGLLPEYAHLFWVTREDVAAKLPPGLPEILSVAAWHHPDLAGQEQPGDSETFRQLARVLATGEVRHYRPRQLPNTHWVNWPDGGAL